MKIGDFEILIASLPQFERVVAEIYYKNMHWAMISWEDEKSEPLIQFFSNKNKKFWEFKYCDAINALEAAKKHLLCEE